MQLSCNKLTSSKCHVYSIITFIAAVTGYKRLRMFNVALSCCCKSHSGNATPLVTYETFLIFPAIASSLLEQMCRGSVSLYYAATLEKEVWSLCICWADTWTFSIKQREQFQQRTKQAVTSFRFVHRPIYLCVSQKIAESLNTRMSIHNKYG